MTHMTDGSVITLQNGTAGHNGEPGPQEPATPFQTPATPAAETMSVRPHAQLSRSQILDATEQCLVDKGYDGTTIRSIAAILGCAVGSIYRYFTDKRQLLDVVTQRRFRPVIEHLRARQRVAQTARLYAQIASGQPELYRLMFWLASGSPGTGGTPAIVRQIIDGWAPTLGGTEAAELFWSRLHGRLMLGGDVDSVLASIADPAAPRPIVLVDGSPATVATAARHAVEVEDVTLL